MFKKKSEKHATAKASKDKIASEVQTNNDQPDRLITIEKWPDFHPWPPVGGLRHIRFWAKDKGATECFVKKGGRVLVRERKFLEWASTTDAS
ncbi:hypothetical protein P9J64_16685 [Deltaproteobacteria bacterium IMCC39524]|nr:hypothetical protein [Deltaproteobacteria bacterium IMCC39524]